MCVKVSCRKTNPKHAPFAVEICVVLVCRGDGKAQKSKEGEEESLQASFKRALVEVARQPARGTPGCYCPFLPAWQPWGPPSSWQCPPHSDSRAATLFSCCHTQAGPVAHTIQGAADATDNHNRLSDPSQPTAQTCTATHRHHLECSCLCPPVLLTGLQERRQTHEAATVASEEGARLALKSAEHAAKLRQDALREREELKAKKNLTFSQKVGGSC